LALLTATLERHVELDLADVEWMSELAEGRLGTLTPNRFADNLAATFTKWLSPDNRWRTLAGCELSIAGTREEALKEILATARKRFIQGMTILFRLLNAQHPVQAAELCQRFGAGLLYSQTTADGNSIDHDQFKTTMHRIVTILKDT
jgi:hypothetical protein